MVFLRESTDPRLRQVRDTYGKVRLGEESIQEIQKRKSVESGIWSQIFQGWVINLYVHSMYIYVCVCVCQGFNRTNEKSSIYVCI